jgi:hypothetical protein
MSGCGVIGSLCGPSIPTLCPEGSYCQAADGTCDDPTAIGLCTAIPDACTLEFAPVCGCDGETYGNACGAAAAGVNIDHEGECAADGQLCGGIAGFQCDQGEYCQFPGGHCGATDQAGTCQPIPEVCTEEFAPVCGCDDRTYDNACFAAAAGVSVQREGACGGGGLNSPCGGLQGLPCNEGLYCNISDGSCGAADQTGTCQPVPDVCAEVIDPVCGCNDLTYNNACEAAKAGVSVLSAGECPTGP